MKKNFNENLIMTETKKNNSNQVTFIGFVKKLIEDEKVTDHCQITRKFRGAAYCSCNLNLQLTNKVPLILHNFRGSDSH